MSISFIGSTVSILASTPASEDPSDYSALSMVELGKIVSFGELGDESEDISFDLLKPGRRTHVNGVKDLGEIPAVIEYDLSDAGQVILRAANNTNTTHTFLVQDTDGDKYFFQGLVANLRDLERTASQYKGASFVVRGQTGITKIDGS